MEVYRAIELLYEIFLLDNIVYHFIQNILY